MEDPILHDVTKEEFRKMTVMMDAWNCTFRSKQDPYDESIDKLSTKLQKSYYKNYGEKVFKK